STRAGAGGGVAAWRARSSHRSATPIASGVVSPPARPPPLTPGPPPRALQAPPPAPPLYQRVGLLRSGRSGGVLRDRRGGVLVPCGQDRIDDAPQRFDLVIAREQGRVAAHRVEDQPLVGLR